MTDEIRVSRLVGPSDDGGRDGHGSVHRAGRRSADLRESCVYLAHRARTPSPPPAPEGVPHGGIQGVSRAAKFPEDGHH